MQIFISWSGEQSRKIADVISKWLPDVIQSVRPFFTPDDVTKGQRWASEIADTLHSSQFGLFCLTADNLTAPWILFEAGALSKDLKEGRVCSLLFGVDTTQLVGPLQQFQATPYSRVEMLKFMKDVNDATKDPLNESQLVRAFDRYWDEFDQNIQSILREGSPNQKSQRRSVDEMVEETLGIVRAMSQAPVRSSEDDPASHWLVLFQSTLDYARTTLQIAKNVEQSAMLDQLRAVHAYVKLVANLTFPKLKASKVGPSYKEQASKVLKDLEANIGALSTILDEEL